MNREFKEQLFEY